MEGKVRRETGWGYIHWGNIWVGKGNWVGKVGCRWRSVGEEDGLRRETEDIFRASNFYLNFFQLPFLFFFNVLYSYLRVEWLSVCLMQRSLLIFDA